MKKLAILNFITSMFIAFSGVSQNIKLTSEQDYKSGTRGIYPLADGTFYSYTFNPNLVLLIFKDEDATPIEKNLKLAANGVKGDFDEFVIVNNKLYVLFETKKVQHLSLYAQEIDQSGELVGEPKELHSYEIVKKQEYGYFIGMHLRRGRFNVILSQNKKYLLVENNDNIIGAQDGEFRFKVFDENLNAVNEGAYFLRSAVSTAVINSQYLSNTGEFFLSARIFEKGSTKGLAGAKQVICSFIGGKLTECNLEVDEKGLLDFKILVKDGLLTCRGFYANDKKNNLADGVFYAEINPIENTVDNIKYDEFQQLQSVAIIEQLDEMEDGSIMMLSQLCFSICAGVQVGFNNVYDQVVVSRFETDGRIKWTQFLGNFFQVSFTNDYVKNVIGYSSKNGVYNVLINRSIKDLEGKNSNDPTSWTKGDKKDIKDNVLVNLELDLSDGAFTTNKIELPMTPGFAMLAEYSCISIDSNIVFLKFGYMSGFGKTCFGRLKL
jgi:hypothetical protein